MRDPAKPAMGDITRNINIALALRGVFGDRRGRIKQPLARHLRGHRRDGAGHVQRTMVAFSKSKGIVLMACGGPTYATSTHWYVALN